MKKALIALLCLLLCASFVLCSCNDSSDDDIFVTTAGGTKKTTQATTTAPPDDIPIEMPTNLVPVIENQNEVISRLMQSVNPDGKTSITVEIYNGETIELFYHGWPTVCKGDGSTLYATASARISHIDPFGAVVFYKSEDNGMTWSKPVIVADTPLDDRDSGVLYMGNGKIIVNWFCHDLSKYFENPEYMEWQDDVPKSTIKAVSDRRAYLEKNDPQWTKGGSFTSTSTDGGLTWSAPKRVPVKSPHGMVMGQDGRTLYFFGTPTANWQLSGATDLQSGYFYLFQSKNYGQSWSKFGEVKLPNNLGPETFFDEGYCIQLKDGSFLAGIRTEKSNCGYWTICITRSQDGKNWTTPTPVKNADGTNLKGSPPHFLQLKNGVIILAYSWRHGNCGSRFRLSYDNGVTWTEEMIICVSDQPLTPDLGYPTTVELDDGTLLTTYYQAYGQDGYPSLLYTRWRLEEAAE